MRFTIKLNKLEWIQAVRNAIRAEGWTGTAGCKQWAKEAYDATLNYNVYGDMSSIKFKTEEACQAFAKAYGIPYLTDVEKMQADPMYVLLNRVAKMLANAPGLNELEIIRADIRSALNNIRTEYGVKE